jgi:SWI/SNF-related matrix-associated actin-dependent regulator 1 of chromatin subfamily A
MAKVRGMSSLLKETSKTNEGNTMIEDIISKEQMRTLLDNFLDVHVAGIRDDIGPNASDGPFFQRLSAELTEMEYEEASRRLRTYRNTQLPFLLEQIGLKPSDGDAFLDTLAKQGKESASYYALVDELKKQIRWSAKRFVEEEVEADMSDFDALVQQLFGHTAHGRLDAVPDVQELYNSFVTDMRDAKERAEQSRRLARTIKCEVYEDVWYGRNDVHRRYPKKSNRILMRFSYDEQLISAIKSTLVGQGRCIWKPEYKAWSLKMDSALIDTACQMFESQGYYTDQLLPLKAQCSAPTTNNTSSSVEASIEGDSLVLKWGWLQDDDLRARVMAIVKGIMGRKWNGQRKVWTVPVAQASFLKGRLDGVYQPLADAIASLPQLNNIIENTAERIAISSASELNDDSTIDNMRERLAEVFPEGRELYPFQYVGVRFCELANGKALIGDDMGVGKTIQALAYTSLHPEHHPTLIVCPANVKFNWLKEARSWLTTLTSDVIRTGKDEIPDTDIVIINYDLMSKQAPALLDRGFNTVIFDESHYLKNYKAQRTQASLDVAKNSKSVLALSGTAITNRPNEFFTTLNLLRPAEFPSFFTYAQRYCDAYHNGWGWDFTGSSNEAELHERTRTIGIRRLKKEVMAELPDKIRQIVDVHPTSKEMKEYRDMARMWHTQYEMHKASGSLPAGFVLNMLTELRHHAGRMKTGATARWGIDYHTTTGKPLIIFTHHRDVQEMVSNALIQVHSKLTKDERATFGPLTMDFINGEVPAEKRQAIVERFQAGEIKFLICSTVSAKEGLTLTEADTVLFVEREWVSGWEEQAEDRVNRIGQDAETVHAVYLSVAGTIDEKFNAVVEEKRATVSAILDGGEVGKRDGIAKALLKAMVDAGEMPADMLKSMGVSA